MRLPSALPALLLLALFRAVVAHPVPDIPVRTTFDADGTCTIRVEMDPRCFEADWEMEAYLLHIQMNKLMIEADKEALKAKSRQFIGNGIEFFFEQPELKITPDFTWAFTTLGGGPLVNIDDPVVLTGTWTTRVPEGTQGYSIRATKAVKFAVNFENTLRGHVDERVAVLFPGEKSFVFDLSGKNRVLPAAAPETSSSTTPLPAPSDTPLPSPSRMPSWLKASAALAVALTILWLFRRLRA